MNGDVSSRHTHRKKKLFTFEQFPHSVHVKSGWQNGKKKLKIRVTIIVNVCKIANDKCIESENSRFWPIENIDFHFVITSSSSSNVISCFRFKCRSFEFRSGVGWCIFFYLLDDFSLFCQNWLFVSVANFGLSIQFQLNIKALIFLTQRTFLQFSDILGIFENHFFFMIVVSQCSQ